MSDTRTGNPGDQVIHRHGTSPAAPATSGEWWLEVGEDATAVVAVLKFTYKGKTRDLFAHRYPK